MSAGHISWPSDRPVWVFDWRLPESGRFIQSGLELRFDAPDSEGIAFTNVSFKGHRVLFKASLPMIRVHYDHIDLGRDVLGRPLPRTAGPFKDSLNAYNAVLFAGIGPIRFVGGVQVRQGVMPEGLRFLVIESSHVIGAYRLTNRWIFREDGIILPQLYSAGLRFPADHRHHVYWRFDFDIDGPAFNLALARLDWWPQDWGWGAGWRPITSENSHTRLGISKFRVLNTTSRRGYEVLPGPNDGEGDSFSAEDFWVHRFHPEEDRRGALGSETDDQLVTLNTGESTDQTDIVLWYCAHLSHEAAEGGDEWHACGPILVPFGF
jgi:hypothetical protein